MSSLYDQNLSDCNRLFSPWLTNMNLFWNMIGPDSDTLLPNATYSRIWDSMRPHRSYWTEQRICIDYTFPPKYTLLESWLDWVTKHAAIWQGKLWNKQRLKLKVFGLWSLQSTKEPVVHGHWHVARNRVSIHLGLYVLDFHDKSPEFLNKTDNYLHSTLKT